MDILKRKAELAAEKDQILFACLMMDEMSLRQQVDFDKSSKRQTGYVDFGCVIDEPQELLAKYALVHMLTGVNQRWKIPIAYFFINSLTAEERAAVTKKVLEFVSESNIKIIAFTFDGLSANISMCKILNPNMYNKRPFFSHPVENYNIYIFYDAAHMLKLVRNTLASKKVLYDDIGETIKFKYFENLVKFQESGNFHLANKLNKKHIMWFKNKMNVKLAAQTFSESCATAFEQLSEDGNPDFLGCGATVKLCRIINQTFDLLNSRSELPMDLKNHLVFTRQKCFLNLLTKL